MKKIFEEYGGVIHVALAIVALICVVALLVGGPNGGWIGGAFQDITGKFLDKTTGAMDAVSVNGNGGGGSPEAPISNIVNVKDYGAVGDGATDDKAAIMAAFDYAVREYASKDEPVTVYFPEGEYGLLSGGMYIYMPLGAGNLTVKGDGADKSTIVYLEEWEDSGSWVAIRIQPETTPASVDEYLHDITFKDLGVYDTDPVEHAWNTNKGDPDTEETHGFNVQYCVRATITDCKTTDIGDECFDLSHCIDSEITNNLVEKNIITGKGGGSLSVGDGSKNVTITKNTVVFNTGSTSKSHYAVAVEALSEHVEDIYITNNTMLNLNGWGVNIVAPAGTISDVVVKDNTMTGCLAGGIHFSGAGQTTNVQLIDNTISNVGVGIYVDGGNKDQTLIDNCTIDTVSDCGIKVGSPSSNDTVIQNLTITNCQKQAIYNAGTNTKVVNVTIDGVGLAGSVAEGAIQQYGSGGSSEVSNTTILNCQNKKGIQLVQSVINTTIEQVETSGYISIQSADMIKDCKVNRYVQPKNGCTIDGLELSTTADLGIHAIYLNNLTNCTITNCTFTMPSRYAIIEAGTADYNTITNNTSNGGSGFKVIGANTVASGNVKN